MGGNDSSYIVDVEQNFNDSIFHSGKFNRANRNSSLLGANNSVRDGLFYNEPDDMTYIFKTSKYDIFTREHGIIRPVRYNNLTSNRITNGLAKKKKGVYIIKSFNFYKLPEIRDIIAHYATSAVDIEQDILESLNQELNLFLSRGNQSVLKFRIIKFISEDTLMFNGIFKDSLLNGDLIIGSPSRLSVNNHTPIATTLTIEITDNKQDVYHITIGQEVHSIYAGNNHNGEIGGHIKLTNHGMLLIDDKLTEENIKNYGIFSSKNEALASINFESRLELEKIKHDRMKLDHELELTKLKRRISLEGYAVDIYKRELDLELTRLKYNFEKIKLYATSSTTYLKTGMEIGVKIISMFVPFVKKG